MKIKKETILDIICTIDADIAAGYSEETAEEPEYVEERWAEIATILKRDGVELID